MSHGEKQILESWCSQPLHLF